MTVDREQIRQDAEFAAVTRRNAFDHSTCGNGPDEEGNWPCDPKIIYGSNEAECQTCGRIARWATNSQPLANPQP